MIRRSEVDVAPGARTSRRDAILMSRSLLLLAAPALSAPLSLSVQAVDAPAAVRLITLDPGHFHAALVQKFMYDGVDPRVHVYAPGGDDLIEHLKRIEAFNTRADQPTHWREEVYSGPDYLQKMLADRAGNVVVISGNNARKTEYTWRAIEAGMNVLADKPMVIQPADFPRLQQTFAMAQQKGVLLMDIMTERYEITTALQRALSQQEKLFGDLQPGTAENPAITKESVHHFSKVVAGAPLKRPQWFFDVRQQGEGIVDVTTHLVDLVQWEAFPDQALQPADVSVLAARRWATPITGAQFKQVTGAESFPLGLQNDVHDGALQVYSNGEFTYRLRGVYARVSVTWNFEAPPGAGDTHYSLMRGSKADLIIRQGAEQRFRPVLYVEKAATVDATAFEAALQGAIAALQDTYPGVATRRERAAWAITVPDKYNVGHEAHFAQVTENFLRYLRVGELPAWEVPNMLTKYATIMQAYQLSR
jgi:predicted dehydrogenase